MKECVSDKKNYKSKNNDERKEAECLDDTSLDDMKEEVSDIIDHKNEKYIQVKRVLMHT